MNELLCSTADWPVGWVREQGLMRRTNERVSKSGGRRAKNKNRNSCLPLEVNWPAEQRIGRSSHPSAKINANGHQETHGAVWCMQSEKSINTLANGPAAALYGRSEALAIGCSQNHQMMWPTYETSSPFGAYIFIENLLFIARSTAQRVQLYT